MGVSSISPLTATKAKGWGCGEGVHKAAKVVEKWPFPCVGYVDGVWVTRWDRQKCAGQNRFPLWRKIYLLILNN